MSCVTLCVRNLAQRMQIVKRVEQEVSIKATDKCSFLFVSSFICLFSEKDNRPENVFRELQKITTKKGKKVP